MEPGGSEPGGFNSTGGQDFGYVSDFGFDHDHHDGHGDHGHGDHGHGDHFGDDHAGGDHDEDHDHDQEQNHQNHGHGLKGLIARLLGLDKDAASLGGTEAGSDAGSHRHAQHGQTPSQSVMYSNALAGISLSEAFKGIRVTPNFLYLCLFAGFTFWLFVVYWIRHNEPLANQVLGTGAVNSRTTIDDRRLLNSVKDAMPFRTSSTFGDIYTPNAPHLPPVEAIDQQLMMKAGNAKPSGAEAMQSGVPQTLQQKLLSTAAKQPYEMSSAATGFANQFIGRSVNQAVTQASQQSGYSQAATGQFPQQRGMSDYAIPPSAQRQQGYPVVTNMPYANRYPATIATAGSYYAMPQPGMQAPLQYPAHPSAFMDVPHGLGVVQQQFGSAAPMIMQDYGSNRQRTVINR